MTLATAALIEKPLDACALFHRILPVELCVVAVIPSKTPVQRHYGDLDVMAGFRDKAAADQLETTLKNAKGDKELEIFHYPTEGHTFMNEDDFSKRTTCRT